MSGVNVNQNNKSEILINEYNKIKDQSIEDFTKYLRTTLGLEQYTEFPLIKHLEEDIPNRETNKLENYYKFVSPEETDKQPKTNHSIRIARLFSSLLLSFEGLNRTVMNKILYDNETKHIIKLLLLLCFYEINLTDKADLTIRFQSPLESDMDQIIIRSLFFFLEKIIEDNTGIIVANIKEDTAGTGTDTVKKLVQKLKDYGEKTSNDGSELYAFNLSTSRDVPVKKKDAIEKAMVKFNTEIQEQFTEFKSYNNYILKYLLQYELNLSDLLNSCNLTKLARYDDNNELRGSLSTAIAFKIQLIAEIIQDNYKVGGGAKSRRRHSRKVSKKGGKKSKKRSPQRSRKVSKKGGAKSRKSRHLRVSKKRSRKVSKKGGAKSRKSRHLRVSKKRSRKVSKKRSRKVSKKRSRKVSKKRSRKVSKKHSRKVSKKGRAKSRKSRYLRVSKKRSRKVSKKGGAKSRKSRYLRVSKKHTRKVSKKSGVK